MKYKRLRIANYRGVDASEIEFESRGLTLVQGPNEAGKTSLGEAIGILFEYPDSSKHSIIKAIRLVHRDAGSEIELEAESGPYRFTYFKRFHRQLEMTLTITDPAPENHTGREAHDRAESKVAELEEKLRSLDDDIERAGRLHTELIGLKEREAETTNEIAEQTELLREIDLLEQHVSEARLKLESATKTAELAKRDAKERIEQEHLRDLSYDALSEKLLGLEQTVPDYLANRGSDPVIAADLESATVAWKEAEAARQEAQTEWELARKAVDAAIVSL